MLWKCQVVAGLIDLSTTCGSPPGRPKIAPSLVLKGRRGCSVQIVLREGWCCRRLAVLQGEVAFTRQSTSDAACKLPSPSVDARIQVLARRSPPCADGVGVLFFAATQPDFLEKRSPAPLCSWERNTLCSPGGRIEMSLD